MSKDKGNMPQTLKSPSNENYQMAQSVSGSLSKEATSLLSTSSGSSPQNTDNLLTPSHYSGNLPPNEARLVDLDNAKSKPNVLERDDSISKQDEKIFKEFVKHTDEKEQIFLILQILMLAFKKESKEFKILDLGCGDGDLAAKLINYIKQEHSDAMELSYVGVDKSAEHVEKAKQKLEGYAQCTVMEGDCFSEEIAKKYLIAQPNIVLVSHLAYWGKRSDIDFVIDEIYKVSEHALVIFVHQHPDAITNRIRKKVNAPLDTEATANIDASLNAKRDLKIAKILFPALLKLKNKHLEGLRDISHHDLNSDSQKETSGIYQFLLQVSRKNLSGSQKEYTIENLKECTSVTKNRIILWDYFQICTKSQNLIDKIQALVNILLLDYKYKGKTIKEMAETENNKAILSEINNINVASDYQNTDKKDELSKIAILLQQNENIIMKDSQDEDDVTPFTCEESEELCSGASQGVMKQLSTLFSSSVLEGNQIPTAIDCVSREPDNLQTNSHADSLSGNQLTLNYQNSYDVDKGFVTYYGSGIDTLLPLRVKYSGLRDVAILQASFFNKYMMQYLLGTAFTKIRAGISKVVLPFNIDGKHWVGLVIENNNNNHLNILYVDSENNGMPLNSQKVLYESCVQNGYRISLSAVSVEEQKYSNCGPELIENIIMILTGGRTTQEAAIPLHSLLHTNSVLDPDSSALQIAENSRMIEQLSNIKTPLYSISYLGPKISAAITYYLSKRLENYVAVEISVLRTASILGGIIIHDNPSIAYTASYDYQNQDMALVVQKVESSKIYNIQQNPTDTAKILHLFQKHGIIMTLDEAMTDKGFRKASLKLHPDKGGKKEDFQFFKEFRDKFTNHDTVEQASSSIESTILKTCYSSSLTLKTLDVGINIVRAYHNPTAHNIVDVAIGGSNLLGMITGIAYFSGAASVISVGYTCYAYGIYEGAKAAAISIVFIAAPSALALAGFPMTATALTVVLTGYTAYNLVNNGWSLYNEFNKIDHIEIQNTGIIDPQIDDV